MAKPQHIKLRYVDYPGRAEVTRILLNYAGIPFTDERFSFDDWPTIKPQTPMGQVPVLEVDGKVLAQSSAIERYTAKLAGLIPEDLWAAAKVDEAVGLITEVDDALYSVHSLDKDARPKAHQDMLAGSLKTKFETAIKLLKSNGGKYLCGNELTYADILLYKAISSLVDGSKPGVPMDAMDAWPELKEHHKRIAALPAIAKMYESVTDGSRATYKALP